MPCTTCGDSGKVPAHNNAAFTRGSAPYYVVPTKPCPACGVQQPVTPAPTAPSNELKLPETWKAGFNAA